MLKNKGKFAYETPSYDEDKNWLRRIYLVAYRPDGAFQDMDDEFTDAFDGIQCELIGYFAIQSEILQCLVLPRTVKWIYDYAFAGCAKLQYIILPDECSFHFARKAFEGCARDLAFSAASGSEMIPVLKRFGYKVDERPAGALTAVIR